MSLCKEEGGGDDGADEEEKELLLLLLLLLLLMVVRLILIRQEAAGGAFLKEEDEEEGGGAAAAILLIPSMMMDGRGLSLVDLLCACDREWYENMCESWYFTTLSMVAFLLLCGCCFGVEWFEWLSVVVEEKRSVVGDPSFPCVLSSPFCAPFLSIK